MRDKINVVVVIPFYNGSKFIERSLQSVLEQSTPASEIIIVNDGSSIEERNFLHALPAHHSIKIIDKKNGGQGSARNAGVAASTANFICFLDQDDFFLPDHIETLIKAVPESHTQFGFAYADLKIADGDGNILLATFIKDNSNQNPKTSLVNLLRNDMFVLPSASIIARKAFDATGGFDEQFIGYEDDDLFLRIFRKGFANLFIDRAVTVWCIHRDSTSYTIKMSRSRFRYFVKLSINFNDDVHRGLFFFRDCLLPRFGIIFVREAARASVEKSEHRAEIYEILRKFSKMTSANIYVGRRQKIKYALAAFLLTSCPAWVFRVFRFTLRLPVIRQLIVRRLFV
ncbi:glycosyltransferase family 2 protein [Variovorax sp. GB1P17]|uniref:glycosyltransferase family 2 protein n=1 Tax=Variovorax sp. GB1P17 TaxID=3443740 RepID=UPI003F48A92D